MRVALIDARGPRMRFAFRLHDAADLDFSGPEASELLASGSIELVWVTRDRRPTRLPRDHPAARIFGAVEPLPEWGAH
jgi:acyl-CoA thioesterase FadM